MNYLELEKLMPEFRTEDVESIDRLIMGCEILKKVFDNKCDHPDHVIKILKIKDERRTLPETKVICECKFK